MVKTGQISYSLNAGVPAFPGSWGAADTPALVGNLFSAPTARVGGAEAEQRRRRRIVSLRCRSPRFRAAQLRRLRQHSSRKGRRTAGGRFCMLETCPRCLRYPRAPSSRARSSQNLLNPRTMADLLRNSRPHQTAFQASWGADSAYSVD